MAEGALGPVLDHVVLAARGRTDIENALAEVGLAAGSSRAIPGSGLSNLVVAVGTQLLELHYPDGSPVADGVPPYARVQAEALAEHPDSALVPVAWVVRYRSEEQLRAASERAGYPVIPVPPEPPNNAPYLLGGLGAAFERPWLPTFIHWSRAPHLPPPLVAERDGGAVAGSLELEVSGPRDELYEWCGGEPAGVRIEAGNSGPLRVRVHRPDTESVSIGLPATD